MAATLKDIYKLLDEIDDHARKITAKHSELRSMLASIQLPQHKEWPCPRCGIDVKGEQALRRHLFNVHGEGEPEALSEHEARS